MQENIYGYIQCSAKEQNEASHMLTIHEIGVQGGYDRD